MPATTIARGLPLLGMTEADLRLLTFLAHERMWNGWWVAYQSPSLAEALSLQMGWSANTLKHSLQRLRRRGWLEVDSSKNGDPRIRMTAALLAECKTALRRRETRSWAGLRIWRSRPRVSYDELREVAEAQLEKLDATSTEPLHTKSDLKALVGRIAEDWLHERTP
jgi:hypothetical protein